MTKIALKLQPSCKINSGKRKSKCGKSVCRELSEKVRDSSVSGLNIISEKGNPKKDKDRIPVGFHGSFPLQKPRMLVRVFVLVSKERQGWFAEKIWSVPGYRGAAFFMQKHW